MATREPDIRISGLSIHVHSRSDAPDYWDGNWATITATCEYPGARVETTGTILHLPELARMAEGCERLYETLEGEAELACMEPNLRVNLKALRGGQIEIAIAITPDQLSQSHTFLAHFDQTYLPPIIEACRRVLAKFPVRGEPQPRGGV
jgi:hypothetical protein